MIKKLFFAPLFFTLQVSYAQESHTATWFSQQALDKASIMVRGQDAYKIPVLQDSNSSCHVIVLTYNNTS